MATPNILPTDDLFTAQQKAGGKLALADMGAPQADTEGEANAWIEAMLTGDPILAPDETEVSYEITATGEDYEAQASS